MKRKLPSLLGNQHAKGNPPNRTSFQKGFIPWNKDKKGLHLSKDTEFQKGSIPKNKMPAGSITCRIDKSGKRRSWIKIDEPNYWTEYAKFVWIKNRGIIPKGFLIHHIDSNALNDNINNLSLLTRKAHFEIHNIGALGRMSRRRTAQQGLFCKSN